MAGIISYETGDIVEMKKKHPCGSNEWEILKAGADIKMKCMGCGHEVIIKRSLVQKNTKKLKKCLTRTGIICIIIFAVAIEAAKTK